MMRVGSQLSSVVEQKSCTQEHKMQFRIFDHKFHGHEAKCNQALTKGYAIENAKFLPSSASTAPLIYTIRFVSRFVQESTVTSMHLFDAVSFAGIVPSVAAKQ